MKQHHFYGSSRVFHYGHVFILIKTGAWPYVTPSTHLPRGYARYTYWQSMRVKA